MAQSSTATEDLDIIEALKEAEQKSNYTEDEPNMSFIETCPAQIASNWDISKL